MKVWDRKNERVHELEMTRLSIEADKARAEAQLAIQESQAEAAYNVGALQALVESIRSQGTATGIRWVDALSAMVRPTITFAYFGLYAGCRVATLALSMRAGANVREIIAAAWTAPDMEVLSGILSFWFLDRILSRARR
ncbi:MAG TPA: hypothetical protein VN436_12025, partial [Holophaga sp.]|nr:hypothetical protein [Holophaga sp.]